MSYDALIALYPTLPGGNTFDQNIALINAKTVSIAQKAIVQASDLLNACSAADLEALTATQIALLSLLLQGQTVDASNGTAIRAVCVNIFGGKPSITSLGALVAPFDNATAPWWSTPVAQGGGGLTSPVSINDLMSAGIAPPGSV